MPNDFLEKTLEDIIYENKDIIHTRGLSVIKSKAFRQVILPSGKKIDILGFEIKDGHLDCDIYELKRDTINADAICQAYTYYTELKCLTDGHFSSFKAKLIMVGRKHEPVSIIDALPVLVDVFTYEYKVDGIRFKELRNPYAYSLPNESFSFGLWAFGYGGLYFTEQQGSMNFHGSYDSYIKEKPFFSHQILEYIEHFVKPIKLLSAPPETKQIEAPVNTQRFYGVETVHFPEQPAWSKEFLSGVAHNDILEDFEVDNSDYEPEEDGSDLEDLEPDYDNEPDHDEKWIVDEWNSETNKNHPIMDYINKQQNEAH